MNSQPKWDIYESVVLLNGYLLACKKSEPRAYIIRRVSADLRAMAIHRGRKIDEIFRNENGISYQMQSMDSAYKGRKIYVPATKLFQETVSLYRNQNSRFQELLKEARYMIEHDIAHPALNDTDVFVVDFNDCPDMSFARVNSLTYRGQAILIRPKWRDLYIALLKKLYADYSNEIDSVVGKVYGRASAPFVGNCHSISLMRSPGEFAPDRYVELNISATTVIGIMGNDTNQNRGVILPVLHNIFSCVFSPSVSVLFRNSNLNMNVPKKPPVNGQDIVHRDFGAVLHGDQALKVIDLFDRASYSHIFAAGLAFIGLKVGDFHLRLFIERINEELIPHIQIGQCFLVKFDPFACQASGFFDGGVISGECCEGRELRCSI